MLRSHWMAFQKSVGGWQQQREGQWVLLSAAIFFSLMLLLCLNRYQAFGGYDQGLFNQVFWNNLHGRFFQSSLSAGNSIGVLQDGKLPSPFFLHLGEHFVPDFLLWLPLYALFPSPITLVVLQVGLMTAGGVVLYALARHSLQPNLALMLTAGYYGASAVIGPTFDNFYEQCQLPLLTFGLLLAMEKQRWWLFWLLAGLVLGIREDAGLILFSIGLYLLISRRHPWVGAILCLVSFSYVTAVTNLVMPHFSHDSGRLYLASRFKAFLDGNADPSTLQVLGGLLSHPWQLLTSLLVPFDRRFFYLLELWLPLAFVPAVSVSTWILISVPLLALLVQSGPIALIITIRYAVAVVPGVFYGAIVWWSAHAQQFTPGLRRFWIGCIAVSVSIAISLNPGRAFYFLFPDPSLAQFAVPLMRQWQHDSHVRAIVKMIPAKVSVSTTTFMIPPLSSRRDILRLPFTQLQADQGQVVDVDYAAADLWQLQHFHKKLPKFDLNQLQEALLWCDRALTTSTYGVLAVEDGVVLMHKGIRSTPEALNAWTTLRQQLPPLAALHG